MREKLLSTDFDILKKDVQAFFAGGIDTWTLVVPEAELKKRDRIIKGNNWQRKILFYC